MNNPKVLMARSIGESVKAQGVIVLCFSRDKVVGASWGETKADCKQIAHTLDSIMEDLLDGKIPVWVNGSHE